MNAYTHTTDTAEPNLGHVLPLPASGRGFLMPKTKPAPSPWSNSIVRYADADPATLTPHPQNWRQHPATQPDETRHSHAREVIRVPGVAWLPDDQMYVEVKGWMRPFDADKMERVRAQNPGMQLTMVWEADIREMERATA